MGKFSYSIFGMTIFGVPLTFLFFFVLIFFFFFFGCIKQLLVALVSAYRYEGPHVQEETAKSEAKVLYNAIKAVAKKNPTENEEVIMILATRSKSHIKAVYKYCEEISGNHLQQVINYATIL